jgi:hypothetical protein
MPRIILDREVVKKSMLLACRAPLVHHSQPWRWVRLVEDHCAFRHDGRSMTFRKSGTRRSPRRW